MGGADASDVHPTRHAAADRMPVLRTRDRDGQQPGGPADRGRRADPSGAAAARAADRQRRADRLRRQPAASRDVPGVEQPEEGPAPGPAGGMATAEADAIGDLMWVERG